MIYLIDPKHAGPELSHILYGIPPCPHLCPAYK